MIIVTEQAAAGLREFLSINNASPGEGVKLVPSPTGGVGMTVGRPGEGDEVIRHAGEPLLIVDGGLVEALDGAEVDCETSVVDGQPRTAFRLRPPG